MSRMIVDETFFYIYIYRKINTILKHGVPVILKIRNGHLYVPS